MSELPAAVDFLGLVPLLPMGVGEACRHLAARPADAPFAYVVTPNAQHVVLLSQPDSPLRAPYDAAWMRLCDSQVIRLIARAMFGARLPLATGSDLTVALLRHAIRPDDPVTVIGGDPGLIPLLRDRYGLRRVAIHVPPMGYDSDPDEVRRCVRFVLDHPARFVFVITGAPRSERLLLRIKQDGRATGIGLAVGSALDFATGRVQRAPAAMQRAGLEWLFRLATSPRRLARRYFVESPPILALAVRARLNGGKLPRAAIPTVIEP